MINLLRKLFIKDYLDIKKPKVRQQHGILAGVVGISMNVLLAVMKIIIGLIIGSAAIIGDSINNFSDTVNSVVTIIGYKLSQKPADEKHPFGHGRVEQITGLIISFIMLFIGILILRESIDNIINQTIVKYSTIVIIILILSIIIKLIQGLFYLRIYKIIDSLALRANAFDSFSDILSTSVILIGALLSKFNPLLTVDGYLSLFVSSIIIFNSIKLIKDSSNEILSDSPDKKLINLALQEIESYSPKFFGVHDVMAHTYGPTKIYLVVDIEVSQYEDFLSMHELSDEIERIIEEKYDINLVVHLDPIDDKDPFTLNIKKEIVNKLKSISQIIEIHDLRVSKKQGSVNIVFDIENTKDCLYSNKDIKNILEEMFKNREENYIISARHVDTYYKRGKL